jgi:hypothetical protein
LWTICLTLVECHHEQGRTSHGRAQTQRSIDGRIMKGVSLRLGASNDYRRSARAEYVGDSECSLLYISATVLTSTRTSPRHARGSIAIALENGCQLTRSSHSSLQRTVIVIPNLLACIFKTCPGALQHVRLLQFSVTPASLDHLTLILQRFYQLLIFPRIATPAVEFTSKLDSCLQIRLILVAPGVPSLLNCPYCLHIMWI